MPERNIPSRQQPHPLDSAAAGALDDVQRGLSDNQALAPSLQRDAQPADAATLRGEGGLRHSADDLRPVHHDTLSPRPITRTLVDADLRAFHTDPVNDPSVNEGRHEHVWNVQLVFDGAIFRDARPLRAALLSVLDIYQGKDLPWWSGEDMARAFLTIGTADPIGCIVTRSGYRAEVWR